jgi:hypothetical protein
MGEYNAEVSTKELEALFYRTEFWDVDFKLAQIASKNDLPFLDERTVVMGAYKNVYVNGNLATVNYIVDASVYDEATEARRVADEATKKYGVTYVVMPLVLAEPV